MLVQCMQRFEFEDQNCQERTFDVCGDGVDNDGNGVFDCDGGPEGNWRFAEPLCCPLVKGEAEVDPETGVEKILCILTGDDGRLVFEESCNGSEKSPRYDLENLPPACYAKADSIGCQLP